jgi:hypothetical protein
MRVVGCVCALLVFSCASAPPSHPPARVVVAKPAEPEKDDPAPVEIATASDSPTEAASGLEGVWEGTGHQDDGQTWPVVVTLQSTSPGTCASVDYPSIPCKAVFICAERSESGEVRGREELTEGRDRCIDNGTFTLQLDSAGRLELFWTGGGVTARATLDRRR